MKTICKHAYPSDLCGTCNPPAKEKRNARRSAAACSPSYSARFRLGQDVVELRVPTGDDDNPHCWHGLDLAAAKQLRDELIKSVETLEAFDELRKSIPENARDLAPPP